MKYEKKELSYQEVKDKALYILERRCHSKKELYQKLKLKGAKDEDILKVLEFLEEYKLVDDLDYAKRLAKDLQNLKKLGKKRIALLLSQKGISNDLIEIALSDISDDDIEKIENMIRLKLKGNFDKKNIDKAIRYFVYKGYEVSDIKACIEKLRQEDLERY